MRKISVPKGDGRVRVVYACTKSEARDYRAYLPAIEKRVKALEHVSVIHGFMHKRSPVTAALEHVGHRWTVSMDLRNFFPSCTRSRLEGKIKGEILDACLVDDHAAQGIPTSPALANLAAGPLDDAIIRWIEKSGKRVVYTRYADDLTFSGDDAGDVDLILSHIPSIARKLGWTVNPGKTHVYWACAGRRVILGVSVGETDIRIPRSTRRRLRAAKHQAGVNGDKARYEGLREWSRLRAPETVSRVIAREGLEDELSALVRAWRIGGPKLWAELPDKGPDVDLGDGCVITGDPVQMLGMSTWTTGWTSCTKWPSGQFRQGTRFWAFLRGTRVAYLGGARTMTISGVTRPRMRARALVHTLRSGEMVYDRIYGGGSDQKILQIALKRSGAISVTEAKARGLTGVKVIGHAPATWKAYFDSLKSTVATASEGPWKGRKVRTVHI